MNKVIDYDNLSKKEINKIKKRKRLIESAYNCFLEKGFEKTTIGDITEGAKVAKGTFYLYFKDKTQIQNVVTLYKSYGVIQQSLKISRDKNIEDKTEEFIFFLNEIINYLEEHTQMLNTIYSNLSKGIFNTILNQEGYEQERASVSEIVNDFKEVFQDIIDINNVEEARQILFIILEMVGAVCYNSIILNQPADIDTMKPVLFKCIRKILS